LKNPAAPRRSLGGSYRQEIIMTKSSSHASHPDETNPISAEDVLEDLRAVVRDAEALLRATEGDVGEHISGVRTRVEETLESAREHLHDAAAEKGARIRSATHKAETYVRENPWTALLIAAGVGYLAGVATRRR
jgi:ElaB/YqjD/DUF883 family membrane-anchored ribosome-binding protein